MESFFQPNDLPQQQATDLLAIQNLLRATLDSSMDMIQVFEAVRNKQGDIVDFIWILNNHASEKIYGDVIGKSLLQLQPGVVEEGIFVAFKQVVETGVPQQYEKQYVHEQFDGWFYQSVVKLNDGVATTTSDITSRKKAEQGWQKSTELLQDIIDAPAIGIAVYKALRNPKGEIIDFVHQYINRASLSMLGGEDFIGKLFTDHGENGLLQLPQLIQVIQTATPNSYLREADFRGAKVWFAITNTPLEGDRLVHTWEDVTQRKQAELEILRLKDEVAQQVTDKYQTLFNSMDQGFNLIELIFDDNGHVIDYWQREHNPMFTRLTGITNAIGKRMSELVPYVEPAWHQMIETIYYTGEPIRVDYPVGALGQWFSAYMSRVGSAGSPLIACVYDDITERKRQERFQAYQLELSDALRPLASASRIEGEAIRILGEALDTNRVFYAWIEPDGDTGVIHQDYINGIPSGVGRYSISAFAPQFVADWRAGRTAMTTDVTIDPRFPESARAAYVSVSSRAAVGVPLIKKGRLIAILGVSHASPREWTAEEISLIQETLERMWPAAERACAEEALTKSEERLQLATTAAQIGTFIYYPKEDRGEPDAQMLTLYGLPPDDTLNLTKALADILYVDDRQRYANEVAQALNPAGSGKLDCDIRIVHPDGSVHWMNVRGQVIFENGQVVRMPGVSTDITERKRREANLAFLAEASQELVKMTKPEETLDVLGRKIGDHFNTIRVSFVEIVADQNKAIVRDWHGPELSSVAGQYPLSQFLGEGIAN